MGCNHKCLDFGSKKPNTGKGRYDSGMVRCKTCDIWMIPSEKTTHFFNTPDKKPGGSDDIDVALGCNCCRYKVSRRSKSGQYSSAWKTNQTISSDEKSFEDLENYLKNEINPRANYQYVIIKTLLEHELECDRELIDEELKFYNSSVKPDLEVGLETLSKHGFLDYGDDVVVLELNDELKPIPKMQLVSMCNRYIYRENGPHHKSIQSFTAVGRKNDWFHSFNNFPTKWAVNTENPNSPGHAVYNLADVGDLVYYYPTNQTERGFFGVGIIKKKVEENEPYWPNEPDGKSNYAKRVILDTLYVAVADNDNDLIKVPTKSGLPFVQAMNRIADSKNAEKLFDDTNKKWKIFPEISKPTYYEFLINEPEENWEEQKKNKYATLEIEMSEDLRSVSSDGLNEFLEERFPSDAAKTVAFNEFSDVKKGDVVIAYDGSKI
ncbi:MAG: hypothetical protein HOM71_00615, partial [Deltaproteobacteria bacterium]|nr:hypothetical protein [Deltaproteobacteria bacterium]